MKKIVSSVFLGAILAVCAFAAGGKEPMATGNSAKELSVHMVQNGFVFDEDWEIYRYAALQNNVKLKGVASKNNTNATQAFNLMVASGKLPDIISFTVADLEKLGSDGGVIDLTQLINDYAPNISAFMQAHPRFAKDMYALDGKIYAIPTFYDYDKLNVAYGLFIRTDWLKKFNLKTPTTVAELEAVLTAIVNGDANGNGKKDEIGLFARSPGGVADAVRYSAGMLGARHMGSFYVENGKVNYNPLEPTFKTAIATLADWYKKGLVDYELFTRGGAARDRVLPTNLGTATFDWFVSTAAYNRTVTDIPGFEFLPIPPLKNETGAIVSRSVARGTTNGSGWSISASASDPVAAIKFMDWWFSEDGRRAWNWGIEGKHYVIKDGRPVFTELVLDNPEKLTPIQVLYKAGSQIAGVGVWQDAEYEIATASDIAKKGWQIYMQPGNCFDDIPILKFSTEDQNEIKKLMAPINQTTAEYVQKWILGAADINQDWDSYVKRITSQGLPRVLQLQQAAYDRFNAN
ncbi:extracellular solute-binding protein [Treponema brennaborense]|uniref:Extracellular solute-binding protein family 1 n=1 Tax=Treponema brennaborense (strain DSM 12168 / CIP 105900 / DD5/3) TaxID=906968 RepID=F4LPB8_TREBD|nr:extracellular solute-binding protein [Treponema brennaborense]AEE16980.1 extracellular solute-binding protein family 1 [Treponema brennaborense DSM 12168]